MEVEASSQRQGRCGAAAGRTPARVKHRVRGVWGLPEPEKKVTGLRGMARGGGGPAKVVIWAGRGDEASGSAPAVGGGRRRFGRRGRRGRRPCRCGSELTMVVVQSMGPAAAAYFSSPCLTSKRSCRRIAR
jgi:hypothetical protein